MFNARMYLDFDDCINAKEPDHEDIQKFEISIQGSLYLAETNYITFSPTVVNRLESFRTKYNVEVVWSTTWNESNHVLKLTDKLGGLEGGRVLPAKLHVEQVPPKIWTAWKAEAIIADQEANPLPYIWVDDKATSLWGEDVLAAVPAESLHVEPNHVTGLTLADLDRMEKFLQNIAVRV